MIEKQIRQISDGIKSLKSSLPISGSTVDTYIYKATSSHTYQSGNPFTCTAIFVMDEEFNGQGIVEIALYSEIWSSSPDWQPYNPVFADISNGYYVNDGKLKTDTSGSHSSTGAYTYEVRSTATVYGTLPGHIEFVWE